MHFEGKDTYSQREKRLGKTRKDWDSKKEEIDRKDRKRHGTVGIPKGKIGKDRNPKKGNIGIPTWER